MSGYIAAALILCAFIGADAYLFSKGYNTFFYIHKTPEELRIREAQIRMLEAEAQILDNQAGIVRIESTPQDGQP